VKPCVDKAVFHLSYKRALTVIYAGQLKHSKLSFKSFSIPFFYYGYFNLGKKSYLILRFNPTLPLNSFFILEVTG